MHSDAEDYFACPPTSRWAQAEACGCILRAVHKLKCIDDVGRFCIDHYGANDAFCLALFAFCFFLWPFAPCPT
jgi:hypothetical protein